MAARSALDSGSAGATPSQIYTLLHDAAQWAGIIGQTITRDFEGPFWTNELTGAEFYNIIPPSPGYLTVLFGWIITSDKPITVQWARYSEGNPDNPRGAKHRVAADTPFVFTPNQRQAYRSDFEEGWKLLLTSDDIDVTTASLTVTNWSTIRQ